MAKKFNQLKKPQKFSIKFANMVFILGFLFSLLFAMFAIYKIFNPPEPVFNKLYFIYIFSAAISAILFILGIKLLSNDLKINLSLFFITIGISLYTFEVCLEIKRLLTYDTRSKIQVLSDLNSSGITAYPNIFPSLFVMSNGLKTNNSRIHPMGGISNITTTLGNENGFYSIINLDEHGFNNVKGLYNKKIDILLIGDSYTEGFTVNADQNISAGLQDQGFSVVNLGKNGNGPLLQLATLKEYAESIQPRFVVWLYCYNDFNDLKIEITSSLLQQYLNNNDFSQKLLSRQDEINDILKNHIQGLWDIEKAKEKKRRKKEKKEIAIHIFELTHLRSLINLMPTPLPPSPPPKRLLENNLEKVFKRILEKSKKMVTKWEGTLYFVYLPSIQPYLNNFEDPFREDALRIINELNIPIIDMHEEVFASHPDPLSLFPLRRNGHYNADGYRLVAEAINKKLKMVNNF